MVGPVTPRRRPAAGPGAGRVPVCRGDPRAPEPAACPCTRNTSADVNSDPNDRLLQPQTPAPDLSLEALLNDVSEAVVWVDHTWTARYCNATFAANLGLTPEQIIGRTPFEYSPTDFRRSIFFEACEACLVQRKVTSQIGYSTVLKRWLLVRGFPIRGGGLMLASDASESVVKAYHLAQAAVRDGLTGLGNKLALQQQVDDLVSRPEPFTLVLLGLRRIRDINEAHGYGTGDQMLMEVGSRLQSGSVGSEAVFRVNSDKFAVVLRGACTEAAQVRARQLLALVDVPLEVQGLRILASASAGTVSSPADGLDFEPLLQRAGLALGEAKKQLDSAAQPVVPFRPDMEMASRLRLVLEQDLRQCLDGSQFQLVIQPKVCLNTARVTGAEALIRWIHPTRGPVSPGSFLQVARGIGVMPSIDAWVLQQAIAVCQDLLASRLEIPVSINLSADALADVSLPERLGRELARAGVPPSLLEVEIPEGDLMLDVQASTRTLQALHTMGVRLSIDDFGTGYSSFAYLAQFPVHTLKIDRSFVSGLDNAAENRKIVKAIIRLAHSLGLSVVGEGAETRTQMQQLRRLKCDAVQGFVVARPMKPEDFKAFVAGRASAANPDPMSI